MTLPRRSASLPDVPTIAEAGVRGYEFTAWQSIVVPAGTEKAIVGQNSSDSIKVLALPDVKRKLVDEGANELDRLDAGRAWRARSIPTFSNTAS